MLSRRHSRLDCGKSAIGAVIGMWQLTPHRTFYPVTDNAYITARASAQLSDKKVNGKNLLVGVSGYIATRLPLVMNA